MTAPAHIKTWEFSNNNRVFAENTGRTDTDDGADDQRKLFYGMKEAMIDGGTYTDAAGAPLANLTAPWVVEGSSDFVASNMTGTDLLTDPVTDIRWSQKGSAEAHSWIVLSNANLGGNGLHVLFNHECGNGFDGSTMDIVISENGFGVANGGTDGSITARPTATDEVLVLNGSTSGVEGNWGSGVTGAVGRDYAWHFQQSSDGECCRFVICHNNNPIGFWILDTARDPVTGWTEGFIVAFGQSSNTDTSHSPALGQYFDNDRFRSIRGGIGGVRLYATSEVYDDNVHARRFTHPNQLTDQFDISFIGLASLDAGFAGRHGRLFDAYWGVSHSTGKHGQTFPDDGTRTWVQWAELILPWDGSRPEIS